MKRKNDRDTTIRISREIHNILEEEAERQKISIKQLLSNLIIHNYKKSMLDSSDYSPFVEGIPNIEFNINRFNYRKSQKKIYTILSRAKEVYIKMTLYADTVDNRVSMDISGFLNKNKLSKIHYFTKRTIINYPSDIIIRLSGRLKASKLPLLKSFLRDISIYIIKKTDNALPGREESLIEDKELFSRNDENNLLNLRTGVDAIYSIFLPSEKTMEQMRDYMSLTGKEMNLISDNFEFRELNEEEILEEVITAFINTNYKIFLEIVPTCFGNKTYPLVEFVDCL